MRKKLLFYTILTSLIIALPVSVLAMNKEFSQSVYVAQDEIVDGNFVKVGNVIDINGAVNGDVIVAGNSINVNGDVAGDVIVAGSSVRINGKVGGSIRAVGSIVEINNEVAHNVWAGAGNIILGPNSKVGWDVYAGAGSVQLNGEVAGNVWSGAGAVIINGAVGKNLTASVDTEGQVVLNSQASVAGDLIYRAADQKQLVIKEGATVAGEVIKKALINKSSVDAKRFFSTTYLIFKIISFFSLLIIGLLLISLLPKKLLEVRNEMIKRPAQSIGWGFVYLVVTPVAVGLLFITVIGIPLALIIMPIYIIGLYISKVIASFTIGLILVDRLSKDKYRGVLIWPLVLGLLVFFILSALPFLGWVIGLIMMLWAIGALIQVKKDTIREWK